MQHPQAEKIFRAVLGDRGVVSIVGEDAKAFLQGLITNDVSQLEPGKAIYAALLSAQGKILFDFLVTEAAAEKGGGLYLDCPLGLTPDLVKRFAFYKLRANVTIADCSTRLHVGAIWGASLQAWPSDGLDAAFPDPRNAALGWRIIGSEEALPAASDPGGAECYEAHRIQLGVPRGGIDFGYGDSFAHDANLDLIHGVDFKKGCFVGQEVVSRVEHRGTARKRVIRVHFTGRPPPPGSEIMAQGVAIGTFGSATAGVGLAMIRTDRAEEAISGHAPLMAGGVELTLAPAG